MSYPEVLLWRQLRGKPMGLKFRRQFPVPGYVANFACVEMRLLIEIDGAAHAMGARRGRFRSMNFRGSGDWPQKIRGEENNAQR